MENLKMDTKSRNRVKSRLKVLAGLVTGLSLGILGASSAHATTSGSINQIDLTNNTGGQNSHVKVDVYYDVDSDITNVDEYDYVEIWSNFNSVNTVPDPDEYNYITGSGEVEDVNFFNPLVNKKLTYNGSAGQGGTYNADAILNDWLTMDNLDIASGPPYTML